MVFAIVLFIVAVLVAVFGKVPSEAAGGEALSLRKYAAIPALLGVVAGGFATVSVVDAGEVAVPVVFGEVKPTLREGINVHNPFANLYRMSIRDERYEATLPAKASDNGVVNVPTSVLYSLDAVKAGEVYRTLGPEYAGKIIPQAVADILNDEVGKYTTERSASMRSAIAADVTAQLVAQLEASGIVIKRVELKNFDLPDEVEASIKLKLAAEQDAQRQAFVKQKAEQEAEIELLKASATAEADRILGDAISPALLMRMQIDAFAEAFKAGNGVIYLGGGADGSTFSFLQDPSQFSDLLAGDKKK